MTRTNDQRRAQNRIEVLCGRGATLSAHSRQDNNPSIATVSRIFSRSTGGPAAWRSLRIGSREMKPQVGTGFRDCCETVARPVADDPAMSDLEIDHLTDKAARPNQDRAPCRQASMSPCQQSVINPFENPVSRVSSSVKNAVHWNGSESTGSR